MSHVAAAWPTVRAHACSTGCQDLLVSRKVAVQRQLGFVVAPCGLVCLVAGARLPRRRAWHRRCRRVQAQATLAQSRDGGDGWDDEIGSSEAVPLSKRAPLLIDGRIVIPEKSFKVTSPATGELVGVAPDASDAQIEEAVHAAKLAAESWGSLRHAERGEVLASCAAKLRENLEPLAALQTSESGRPIPETRLEVIVAAACLDAAGRLLDIDKEKLISEDETKRVVVQQIPLGVTAVIAPWNAPIVLGWKPTATALACGNTVVLKPAPQTPLTTLRIGELLRPLLPPGVLNVVCATDTRSPRPGEILTSHPAVKKVVFTGSTAIGSKVMAACAKDFKRLLLELGGNDAAIVCADCDVDMVADGLFKAAFFNNGQTCCAAKRIYVHESIYDKFTDAFAARARRAVLGNGLKEGVELGPLANYVQLKHVTELVEDAKSNGGRVLCGGGAIAAPPGDESSSTGLFYLPTIMVDVREGTRLVDEEQFGPVVPVMPYKDDEEAIRRANATPYGLGASVWSSDHRKANRLAYRLKAGTIWVNRHCEFIRNAPFGGIGSSGIGRAGDLSEQDIHEYTETRTLCLAKEPSNTLDLSVAPVPHVEIEERARNVLRKLFSRAAREQRFPMFETEVQEAMRTFPFQPLNLRTAVESLWSTEGPPCVVIRGLPLGPASGARSISKASLLGALGLLGADAFTYRAWKDAEALVHNLLPDGLAGSEAFGWHRDGRCSPAFEPPRFFHRPESLVPEVVAALCLKNGAAEPLHVKLVDFRRLRRTVSMQDFETLKSTPLAFFDAELGVRSERVTTVMCTGDGNDAIFELREPGRFEPEGDLTAVAAYERLRTAAERLQETIDLQGGDMVIFHNRRCAHRWVQAGKEARVQVAIGSRGVRKWPERNVQ
eukprot:TRINITY_DN42946_c0_g1_i1.p1 TRINITY_DN42946_c0_g1~~TRINITY_DN42946_c0_g1_i1.p1  ORF type:complete len:891 (-),score=154.18 TRINITY_DN42946_c0_g1_i1:48-2720(-)